MTRAFLLLCLLAAPAIAAESNTAEPVVKRFAALRYEETNLRTGPGKRYPVEWVYRRKNLPVEIIASFDVWHRIRDWEGTEGWVHKTKLRGVRSGIVTGGLRPLRRKPDTTAAVMARMEPGVIFTIDACVTSWCHAETGDIDGWIKKTDFYGAYPNEVFD